MSEPLPGSEPMPGLEADIVRFCQSGTVARETLLSGLLNRIFTEAKAPWVQSLARPHQQELTRAIAHAVEIPITDRHGKVIAEWIGNHCVVELNLDGEILAASSDLYDEVFDAYGSDLYAYALAKAVQTIHLIKSHRQDSTSNDSAADYLEDLLGGPGKVYVGAYFDYDADTVTGASGCEVPYWNRLDYTPGALHEDRKQRVNHLAGAFDEIFARLVAECHGRKAVVCRESAFLRRLRRMH